MNGQVQTWRQVLQQRGQHSLIGRQREYEVFRLNFIYQVPEYLIFAISGAEGIGKTSLLRHYRAIAQEHGAITPMIDAAALTADPTQTILQILVSLARQLTQASTQVTTFDEQYRQYTETLQMIAADAAKPAGAFDFIKGLAQPETAPAWDAYLYEKSLPPDHLALLKNPVETLTRAFVKDLSAWATIRRIVFCFDDWEVLEPQVGDWLRAILAPGELNTNIWLLIAGNEPPGVAWAPFRAIMASLSLQPLTSGETHAYLSACGLTDPARLSHIWNHSKGVPLWMSLLAGARGPHSESLALNPIDRYLKWLAEPWQRETVVRCAAARYLTADMVQTLTDNPEAFAWLRQTPLLSAYGDDWRYPPVLRQQLLDLTRQQAPATLEAAYTTLRDYYAQRLAAYGEAPHYRDPAWRRDQLEYLYYGLLLNDGQAEQEGLALFICALRPYAPLAGEVVRVWQEAAAMQAAPNAITDWADTLGTAWQALERRDWPAALILCDLLMRRNDLSYDAQEELHVVRIQLETRVRATAPIGVTSPAPVGEDSRAPAPVIHTPDVPKQVEPEKVEVQDKELPFKEPAEVLAEDTAHSAKQDAPAAPEPSVTPAPPAEPESPAAAAPEAPVEVAPPAPPPAPAPAVPPEETPPPEEPPPAEAETIIDAADYANRGNVYLNMGEYQKAIHDYTRALELDPAHGVACYNRALAYTQLHDFEHAAADYTRTIELNPQFGAAYKNRGVLYAGMQNYRQAIADYTQALTLNPEDAATYNNRGHAYYNLKEYIEALADYDRAIGYDPRHTRAYLNRGLTYAALEEYQQAIADYNQALLLNANHAAAYNYRGQAYARLEQYPQALSDYDKALELAPKTALFHNNRGLALVKMRRYAEAIEAYQHASALSPEYATAYYNAACAAALMGNAHEACTWLEQAIALHPQYRIMAKHDADFQGVAGNLKFSNLINPPE